MQGRKNRARGKLYRIHITRYLKKKPNTLGPPACSCAFMSDPGITNCVHSVFFLHCTLTVDTGGLATWAHIYRFPSLFNVVSTLIDSEAVTKVCGQQLERLSRLSWSVRKQEESVQFVWTWIFFV